MTDYVKDYQSGKGIFYQEAVRLVEKFETDAMVVEDIVRWKSNGRVPPDDILELWAHVGKQFSVSKSIHAQEDETRAWLAEYRANYKGPTAEEKAEARAELGAGITVVNVITGHKYVT